LWWGAELLRIGEDYKFVHLLFPLADLVQFLGYRFMRIKPLATACVEALQGAGSEYQQAVARELDKYGGDHVLDAYYLAGEGWSLESHSRYLELVDRLKRKID
jgi:hypothetical protein